MLILKVIADICSEDEVAMNKVLPKKKIILIGLLMLINNNDNHNTNL
jgi:hypothetical protein